MEQAALYLLVAMGSMAILVGVGVRIHNVEKRRQAEMAEYENKIARGEKLTEQELRKYKFILDYYVGIQKISQRDYEVRWYKASGEAKGTLALLKAGGLAAAKAYNQATLDVAVNAAKQKENTKTIVKDAVIGGVVAGPAGAVVGAAVGKSKVDQKDKTTL